MNALNCRYLLLVLSCVCAIALSAPRPAAADPFDLIVPSTYQRSTNGLVSVSVAWGWIIPTGGTMTDIDLQNATASFAITGAPTGSQIIDDSVIGSPLVPGNVAGLPNSVYDTLLNPGESLVSLPSSVNLATFNFPENYSGTETLTASLKING